MSPIVRRGADLYDQYRVGDTILELLIANRPEYEVPKSQIHHDSMVHLLTSEIFALKELISKYERQLSVRTEFHGLRYHWESGTEYAVMEKIIPSECIEITIPIINEDNEQM